MKKILSFLLLLAITAKAQVSNLTFVDPGIPGVVVGDQIYIASIKINQNTLALSNAIVALETSTNSASASFLAASNYANALFNINSNSIVAAFQTSSNFTFMASNGVYRATSLGTNIFYYSSSNSFTFISNSLYANTKNCTHMFRNDGPYYLSSYWIDGGTFSTLTGAALNLFYATNCFIVGIGQPVFIVTNCYNVPAQAAPDTNFSGCVFNFLNFKGIGMRDITIMWTNVPNSSTNIYNTSCISIQGTNCSDGYFEHVILKNFPRQGFAPHVPGLDNAHTNICYSRCEFYNGGATNIAANTTPWDGVGICTTAQGIVERCKFIKCVRGVEVEGSSGLIQPPTYGNLQIINNQFIDIIEHGILLVTYTCIDDIIISGNIFQSSIVQGNSQPTGVYGNGGSRISILGNHFTGRFYGGVYLFSSGGTNMTYMINNNTFTSNYLSIVINDAGSGVGLFLDTRVCQNTFKDFTGAAIWYKGVRYIDFSDNLVLNGRPFMSDLWVRPGSFAITNARIVDNNFIRTNTGTYTNIIWEQSHNGADYDIRGNKFTGNNSQFFFDAYVNQSTNIDNIPVNNLVRTNIRHSIAVSGSYRIDATTADASMACQLFTRSNNLWVPKIINRAFAASNTPIHEVPFRLVLPAGALFCITNISGAGCTTNWTYEYQ